MSWNIVLESSETLIRLFAFLSALFSIEVRAGSFSLSFLVSLPMPSTISVTLPNCHRNATYLDLG